MNSLTDMLTWDRHSGCFGPWEGGVGGREIIIYDIGREKTSLPPIHTLNTESLSQAKDMWNVEITFDEILLLCLFSN